MPSKHGGKTMTGCAIRKKDGTTMKSRKVTINKLKCPGTIWDYANGGDKNKLKRNIQSTTDILKNAKRRNKVDKVYIEAMVDVERLSDLFQPD